jgi:CelD/BcsL family acetyltransferase involved in cellulose biosynthesis
VAALRDAPPTSALELCPLDPAEVERTWRAVEARHGAGLLTCGWDWTSTWLEHLGATVEHQVVAGLHDGGPVAVALLTAGTDRRRGPVRIRALHVGTAGEPRPARVHVESNRLLCDPAWRPAFARGLLARLRATPRWDELQLDGFEADDADALLAAAPDLEARREVCRTVDLAAARAAHGGEVLPALPTATRSKIRWTARRLPGLELELAATPGQALEILEELVALHQARWTALGHPGAFADPRTLAFHRALVLRLLPRGSAVLARIATPQRTVGCVLAYVEHGRLLRWQAGFAPPEHPRQKPAMVSDWLLMEHGAQRGWDVFDHLAGDSRYKREMSTSSRELVWMRGRARGVRAAVLAAGARARARGRDRAAARRRA